MQSHFVLDTRAGHIIAFTRRTIGVEPELGYDKNGQPACSFRVAIDARQHQVDNVVRDVVLAIGDINFLCHPLPEWHGF